MDIRELTEAIQAACPIDGLNSSGAIWFRPEATPEQRAAAQALMDTKLPRLEPPKPMPPAERLAAAGLTVPELKTLLGLP